MAESTPAERLANVLRRKGSGKDVEDIVARHMEDLGARLPLGVVIPDEAEGAIRGTLLAALEEALS